jgi:excisionase family DNA binding protein
VRVEYRRWGSRRRDTCRMDTVSMPANRKEPEPPGLAQVQFLTVAEVATMMRVSKMTVYRLVHNGELPAVRVGKSFRVPEQAVHDYLRSAYFDAG